MYLWIMSVFAYKCTYFGCIKYEEQKNCLYQTIALSFFLFYCIHMNYDLLSNFWSKHREKQFYSKKKLEIRDNEIQQNFLLFILIMHVRHIKYKIKSIVCFTPCLEGEGEHIVLALSVRPFVRNKFSQDDKHLIFGVQPQLVVTCRAWRFHICTTLTLCLIDILQIISEFR